MKIFLGIVLLFLPGILNAAVAFDAAVNSGDLSNTTSGSWSHTVTGANTYIFLGLAGWDAETNIGAVTATYASVSLTELGGRQATGSNNSILWGLAGAATGANTMAYANVPASYAELAGGSVSFTGVHQTVSVGTLVSDASESTNPSVDITMVTGDIGVDILYSGTGSAAPVAGANETGRVSTQGPNDTKRVMMGTEAGNGTVTMDWTDADGYDVSYSAIPLLQSVSAGAAPVREGSTIRRMILRSGTIR